MKKSQSINSIRLPGFTRAEIKRAFRWIDSLTPAEKSKFELSARVHLAHILMKHLRSKSKQKST